MGEDVTQWIFEYISESDDDDDTDEDLSSDDSDKDWHILKEESEHEIVEKFQKPFGDLDLKYPKLLLYIKHVYTVHRVNPI